jgi:N-acyl-D-amino-acid deacylase
MYDIIIKNGTVIDGTGAVPKKLDVAIQNGKIVEVAANIDAKAGEVIDAKDKYVTPGFIDIQNHSDSYWTIFDQPDQSSLLSQGITTIVMGNCGASLAPLLSSESIKTIQKWHNLTGVNINWSSVEEYLQILSSLTLGVNVATLVGHATLTRGLIGDDVRALKADELKVEVKTLRDALEQGAFGLSMGLVYAHEVNSSAEELLEITKNLKEFDKYLSVHMRSETEQILESIDEAIILAQQAEIAVKISHLKIRGANNWPLFERMITKLEKAYHQGLKVSFDIYPYDSTWAVLYTYLPKWAYEGGRARILEHLKDPISRRKILDFIKSGHLDYTRMIIASAIGNESFVGKSIASIATNQNISPSEALVNVIAATNAQVVVFDHNLSTEHVELLASSPLSMIATDGAGYSGQTANLIHPRCFGTMPRFLKMVRERKILKWEEAIKKITAEPADLLRLADRGRIVKNSFADIVVFDPQKVTDNATYAMPDLFSDGIEKVLVNGKLVYANKKTINLTGVVLKR